MGIFILRSSVVQGSEADPYLWYPDLDLNTIPFHTGSGAWGAQLAIQTPAAPVITSESNAATWSELVTAMGVSGRRVTLTANIVGAPGDLNIQNDITDVELVIPNGILFSNVVIGNSFVDTDINRFRITKATGDTIGGQAHNLWIIGGDQTVFDVVIDGIQLSADTAAGAAINATTITRFAVVNNRIAAQVYAYGFGCRHMVVAGNSVLHDADGTIQSGDWGFRGGASDYTEGPYIYYRNDIRGVHYSHIRSHPVPTPATPTYTWVKENTFVGRGAGENRFVDLWDTTETPTYPDLDGGWILDNTIWADDAIQHDVSRVAYLRMNGNVVHGATSGLNATGVPDADITGNTYNAAQGTTPAWGAAGDPTGIDYTP